MIDKATFTGSDGTTWWLLEQDIPRELEQRRELLTTGLFSGNSQWYNEQQLVESLYDTVYAESPRVLEEYQADWSETDLARWMDQLVSVVLPDVDSEAEAPISASAPVAAPPEAASAAPATVATPKKSIFAQKSAVEEATAPPAAAPDSGPAAEGGGASAGAAPEAKKSIFAKKSAGPESTERAGGPAAAAAEATAEIVLETFAALPAEGLSEMAEELSMSEDQLGELLNDAEFADMVATELAALG